MRALKFITDFPINKIDVLRKIEDDSICVFNDLIFIHNIVTDLEEHYITTGEAINSIKEITDKYFAVSSK